MDCVIVGGGVGGFQAAFACRAVWPQKQVTLIDAEAEVGYYRTLLPQYMVRTLIEDKLFFWRPGTGPHMQVRTGARVVALDRERRELRLHNDETLPYERLILACGGRPILPPVCPGTPCQGVFPVRYLSDARAVRAWLPEHREVVVLGGGLVGVKTAAYLAHAGFRVTVVEKEATLLPMALSAAAAGLVELHLQRIGIRTLLGCSVEAVQADTGRLREIRAGGVWVPCQTLLIAAGSVPDVDFLTESGLIASGKLTVSASLQTADANILAIGDAVTIQHAGEFTPWTWPQAVCQGKLAGANSFSPTPAPLTALSRVNTMNLAGLPLAILGAPVPDAETVAYSRPAQGIHREFFIRENRLVGGALIGDISGAGPIHAGMIAGRSPDDALLARLTPHKRAFPRRSWNQGGQAQRALFLSA